MRMELHPTGAVAVLAAAAVLVLGLSTALLLWEMRASSLASADTDTLSMAHMLREQTERAFEATDAAVRAVQQRLQTAYGGELPLEGPAVHQLLRARSAGTPHLQRLSVYSADGRWMNSSQLPPEEAGRRSPATDFKAFRVGPAGDLYVGEAARAGAAGRWTINVARAFAGTDGTLRGMVVATMEVPSFEQLYRWMKLRYERPASIYLADGTLVASLPPRDSLVGEDAPELRGIELPPGDNQVHIVARPGADAGRYSLVLGRVGVFPLIVGVSDDHHAALDAWRDRALAIAGGAILVCVFLGVLATGLLRSLSRREQLARALREADARYQCMLDSVGDGVVGIDAWQRVTFFNPAAAHMFGVPREGAVGMAFSELMPARLRPTMEAQLERGMHEPDASGRSQAQLEAEGVRANGSEFPIEGTITKAVVHGEPELMLVLRDVSQRRRAEAELRESNEQLRGLSASLQEVREQERTRIAAELHDDLGQQLTGLKLELSWLARQIREGKRLEVAEMDTVREQLDGVIASMRRIALELRPLVLDDLGLGEAIACLAAEFSRRGGVEITVDLSAAPQGLVDAQRTALYRVAQEALTNVIRHSRAGQAWVVLATRGASVSLRVEDDGRGIPPARQALSGFGLVAMRERVLALGGQLRIGTRGVGGTVLDVIVPLQK
jgi:PAS domain S-box-containing protein